MPNFKFKSFDQDLKTALQEIDAQKTPEEIALQKALCTSDFKAGTALALERLRKGVNAVFEAYLKNDTLDPLIAHFTKDLDAGGGDEYYLPISKRLVELKDGDRLTK